LTITKFQQNLEKERETFSRLFLTITSEKDISHFLAITIGNFKGYINHIADKFKGID